MSLSVGSRIGEYEVVGHLGSGGMGDVYRAHDTRLGREVALKVVLERHADDPAQAARLRREARLLASLNHPNIATIHGILDEGGVLCLVLELVTGASLSDRLAQGPLSLSEALAIGVALASALEAAHDAGIVHRDIKPSNVKLRADGRPVLLDFGVGKSSTAHRGAAGAPTLDATEKAGFIGTPGYMSPEQARAQPVDRRADAWGFGCVLFECLAGKPAFPGSTPSDRLAASLSSEPDWEALPDSVPAGLMRVLEGCLEKEPAHRLRDLRDARLEIEAALGATTGTGRRVLAPPIRRARRARIAWTAAVLALAAALAAATWTIRGLTMPPVAEPARFELALPEGLRLHPEPLGLALSADGRRVVLAAETEDHDEPSPVVAVRGFREPAWTPFLQENVIHDVAASTDGSSVAMLAMRGVFILSESGTVPLQVASAVAPAGIAWGKGDDIFYAPTRASPIWRVPAGGGEASALTVLRTEEGELSHRWPHVSPDGRHLTYTVKTATTLTFDDATVRVRDLRTGEDWRLVEGGTSGALTTSGHVVFARRGHLHAAPVDADRRVAGIPVELGAVRMDAASGSAAFAVAGNGTLVFRADPFSRDTQVEIILRDGTRRAVGVPGPWHQPAVSPDGSQVLLVGFGANDQVWVMDLADGRTRALTRGGGNRHAPTWMPDGKRIVYYLEAPGRSGIHSTGLDGSGLEEPLLLDEVQSQSVPVMSVAPDGSALYACRQGPGGDFDIFRVPLDGSPARVVLARAGDEDAPRASPDGRWLAFVSDASIHVVALEDGAQPLLVSAGFKHGVLTASWGRGGRELYFSGDGGMQVVQVPEDTSIRRLAPPVPFIAGGSLPPASWDALPDGSGIVTVRLVGSGSSPAWISAWTGFVGELERLAPHPR